MLIDLINELFQVRADLGPQRRSEHLAGAVADDLIEQRSTRTGRGSEREGKGWWWCSFALLLLTGGWMRGEAKQAGTSESHR
jgi:hypothetical protein